MICEDTTSGILHFEFFLLCGLDRLLLVTYCNMSTGKGNGSTAANKAVPKKKKRSSSSAKAGLQFPVGRIGLSSIRKVCQ